MFVLPKLLLAHVNVSSSGLLPKVRKERAAFSVVLWFLSVHVGSVCNLFAVLFINHFDFDDGSLVQIVSVPGHCLPLLS